MRRARVDVMRRRSSPTGSMRSRAINISRRRRPTPSKSTGKKLTQLSADAGYGSMRTWTATEEREIDAYTALGRAEHAREGERRVAPAAAMRERIKAGGFSPDR